MLTNPKLLSYFNPLLVVEKGKGERAAAAFHRNAEVHCGKLAW